MAFFFERLMMKETNFKDTKIPLKVVATDLIKGAYENLYDIAIVISGDADFIPAINLVRKKGKKVINAFFPKSSSYLLRKCCDGSINLRKVLS